MKSLKPLCCPLTKKSLQERLDLVSYFLMWLFAYTFIDKHADFPDLRHDTGADARRELYDEWLGLAKDCIQSHRERFIFALYRLCEGVMIGYSWNRIGLLASIRKCVGYIGRFLPKKNMNVAINQK